MYQSGDFASVVAACILKCTAEADTSYVTLGVLLRALTKESGDKLSGAPANLIRRAVRHLAAANYVVVSEGARADRISLTDKGTEFAIGEVRSNGAAKEYWANPMQAIKVLSATVVEAESKIHVVARTPDGKTLILNQTLSPDQLHDYRTVGDAYFGQTPGRHMTRKEGDDYALFEWMMDVCREWKRDDILLQLANHPRAADFAKIEDDEELRVAFSETAAENMILQSRRK